MPCDEQLVARVRAALKRTRGTVERRMFGGVCFTLNGNMACGVVSTDLMVRVGPDKYDDALRQSHVREMDFTGRAMKGYVFISTPGTKNDSSLKYWTKAAVAYVETLPPKPHKDKRA
jgi:TfoX/Sxy family transcriptional regulator of competence genes